MANNKELANPFALSKGYQKTSAISIEAVQRYKNSDDRSFAMLCKMKDGTIQRVVMKDDDAVLICLTKWTDIYDLNFHVDRDNDKYTFPEDDQPIVTIGYRGSGVMEKAYISDITSPIREEKPKPTPTIPDRTEDDVRHDLAKIAVQYSIPESTFLIWIPEIGGIEAATKDAVGAQLFLDKFQQKCLEHNLAKANTPPMSPESAKLLLGRSHPHEHIDTKEDKPVDELNELKSKKSEMDDWFPRDDVEDDERPAALTVGEQAVADVQAMKDKKESDIIEGEIIKEEPAEPAKPDPKPEQQETDFKKAAAEQVAKMINDAFPSATREYKMNFFDLATGFKTAAQCIDLKGVNWMFDALKAEIEKAKQNQQNLPTPEKASEKPQISNDAPPTPVDPVSSNGDAPDKKSGQSETALTTVQTSQPSNIIRSQPRFLMPSKEEFDYMKELAAAVGMSKFYKDVDTKEKALVIMMKGYILGIDPVSALDGVYVINGRPYLSAKLLKGLVERTGMCQRFEIIRENERCIVTVQRRDRAQPNIYTFTKEDAVKAGLWSKDIWQKYPKDMLCNRATMRAIKGEWPEIDLGPMASDEDSEFTDNEAA